MNSPWQSLIPDKAPLLGHQSVSGYHPMEFTLSVLSERLTHLSESSSERRKLCIDLAAILIEAIERIDAERHGSWNAPRIDREQLTVDVARSLAAIGNENLEAIFRLAIRSRELRSHRSADTSCETVDFTIKRERDEKSGRARVD